MILIISAQQPRMDGLLDDRFGRCPWLVKMDTETEQWEAVANPGASQPGGAGVAAAQCVVDQKSDVVISGDFGPHAANVFRAARIKMLLFPKEISTVQQAVEYFHQGKLIDLE